MMVVQVDTPGQQARIQPVGITLRRMRLEDIDQAHAIDRLSFSLPWPANSFRYELEQNLSSLLWVAEARLPDGSSRVVGTIVVWMILDEAHIATLAVLPEYRQQGISRRLLAEALVEAIDHGALSATLEVRASNQIAQVLYHKFRFEVVGIRRRYYQDNHEDALIMTVTDLGSAYRAWLLSRDWER